jgi:hypothetical protein
MVEYGNVTSVAFQRGWNASAAFGVLFLGLTRRNDERERRTGRGKKKIRAPRATTLFCGLGWTFLVQPIIVVELVHRADADRKRVVVLVSVQSTQLIMWSMTLFTSHHPTEEEQLTMILVARHHCCTRHRQLKPLEGR